MSHDVFHAGDNFKMDVTISNPSGSISVQEFIILDIYSNNYFFWPGWTQDLDYVDLNLTPGYLESDTILEFTWPSGAGSASGLKFWAALLDPATMTIYGSFDSFEFGYE